MSKIKITMRLARDVDHKNAFEVTVHHTEYASEGFTVWTNDDGDGLWIDGEQEYGTSQFSAGKNPRETIRRIFDKRINS